MEISTSITLLVNLGIPPSMFGIVQVKTLIDLLTWYAV